MAEPDFTGLREEVEAATKVPGFETIAGRARRTRIRDRLGSAGSILIALAILVPIGVVGVRTQPPQQPVGRVPLPVVDPPVSRSALPASATVVAVGGFNRDNLYAAVDVCLPGASFSRCSLQVCPIGLTAAQQRAPLATAELRTHDNGALTDVTLTPLTPGYLLLSGVPGAGARAYRRISVGGGATSVVVEPPATAIQPIIGDRLVQPVAGGGIYYARQGDDRMYPLPDPLPNLRDMLVASSVDPAHGWWLTGRDPVSGDLAVSVSDDRGRTWWTSPLGIRSTVSDPVLATYDGRTAYLFVQTASGIVERRTLDDGRSWHPVEPTMPWPELPSGAGVVSRKVGAVVRPDGTLLVWLADAPVAVFLESADWGRTFTHTTGPGGPVVPVSDGYVSVSDPPKVSGDGRSWTNLPAPPYLLPG